MTKRINPVLRTILLLMMTACSTDYDEQVSTTELTIALTMPTGSEASKEGIRVEVKRIGGEAVFADSTDSGGKVRFTLTPGIYEATASSVQKQGNNTLLSMNGTSGQIILGTEAAQTAITLAASKISQLVIKEVYNGGVMKADGKNFHFDKCIILYNNSSTALSMDNLCIGICSPYNSQANNRWYGCDGRLTYEREAYIPVTDGIWYFPGTLHIEPYQQVVVNVHGAIDNTLTYPQSVNYAREDYYCMYDPETGYTNASYYPTPADVIPTSHYLKAVKIGISNAWALSVTSPAVILFQTQDCTPRAFGTNVTNMAYTPGMAQTDINKVVKVPTDWILDGIEVFAAAYTTTNMKRLTATVDAGYVNLTNQHGHTLYRQVDETATRALEENSGRLVYGYAADAHGIDAEASSRQGAHIIYQDTNNSSNDFYERETCSLRN